TFSQIPRTAWTTRQVPDTFWITGDVDFPSRGSRSRIPLLANGPVSYFGVRFERLGIDLIVERAYDLKRETPVLRLPSAQKNLKRRGPKPKAFWAQMIEDIKASISTGELRALCQADIERAMAAWLVEHDEDAGESTIRNYARKVWEGVGNEGQ